MKGLLFAGVLLLLPSPAHAVQIIDGHTTGSSGFYMWSSIDTNLDARRVERNFATHFDDMQLLKNPGRRFAVARDALRFMGTPFVWGGVTPAGFDCSGFVQHVFAMVSVNLPRTADYQFDVGPRVRGSLHTGDLVFFQTYAPGASHVGIYLGNGEFVHSARPFVHISRLSDPYFASRYLGAVRVI